MFRGAGPVTLPMILLKPFLPHHSLSSQYRKDGNTEMEKAGARIEEALALAERDRAPCLPGQWTEELHRGVVKILDKADLHWRTGKKHYEEGSAEEINGKCVDVEGALDAVRSSLSSPPLIYSPYLFGS